MLFLYDYLYKKKGEKYANYNRNWRTTEVTIDMLTNDDIGKLIEVFATKEDLKEAVKDLSTKKDVNNLLNAVDAYAKKADTYFQEMVMLAHKVDRHEKWIQQIAEKLRVKLEY